MTELSELAAAIVSFQAAVPTIPKNRVAKIPTKNGGSYSYNYADLTDIWDAIREPLKENGLAVTQSLVGGSSGWTGIKTTVWHSSGQSFAETVEMQTQGRSPQEVGSLTTYYKRYALAAVLGIATEEDDDGNAATHSPRQTPNAVQADLSELLGALDRAGKTKDDAARWFREKFNKDPRQGNPGEVRQAVDHFLEIAVQQEMAAK